MKKHILAAAVMLSGSLSVFAEGFYTAAEFTRNKIEADVGDYSVSRSENGYGLGVGYNLTSRIALELAYRDLLSFTESDTYEDVEYSSTIDVTAIQFSITGSYPLNQQFSLYGRLGAGRIQVESSYYENAWGDIARESDDETKTRALVGIGVRYAITEHVGARVEYSRFSKISETTLSSMHLGIDYQF